MRLHSLFRNLIIKISSRGVSKYPDKVGDVLDTHVLLNYVYVIGAVTFFTYFFQLVYNQLFYLAFFQAFSGIVFLIGFYLQKENIRWGWFHFSLFLVYANMFLFSYLLNLRQVVYLFLGIMIIIIVRMLFLRPRWMAVHLSVLLGLQVFCFFFTTDYVHLPPDVAKGIFYFYVILTSALYSVAIILIMNVWQIKEGKLEQEVENKEVLLAEVNHRVRNNLNVIVSLINLQKSSALSEDSINVLEQTQSRVYAMAEVHNKLYVSADEVQVDLKEYSQELLDYLCFSYGTEVEVTVLSNGLKLYYDQLIPLGLIINELATNSLKHAFEGVENPKIKVKFQSEEELLRMIYSDNGNGMKEELSQESLESIGLEIVDLLCEQLSAKTEMEASKGFCFKIEFKVSKHET